MSLAHLKNQTVPPMSGKDILPTLPASVSGQLVAVNLVSAVGKVARARHIEKESMALFIKSAHARAR